jgi:DNA replication and repair protein RecF
MTVNASGSTYDVMVRKERAETRISLDGQVVLAASVLAHHLPLLVFNSQAADLLTESPSNRRALLDRTMFHVEPNYVEVWKRYRQALRQRNELVRLGRREQVGYWNGQLSELAVLIDRGRREVIQVINDALKQSTPIPKLGLMSFEYRAGWPEGHALLEELEQAWARDLQAGFTTVGCHRADLSFRIDGRGAGRRLSRGQGKLVVCMIVVALARFIRGRRGVAPLLLIDDLPAELDDMMRVRAVDMIIQLGGQCFFTAIKPRDLPEITDRADTVFHVEPDTDLSVR